MKLKLSTVFKGQDLKSILCMIGSVGFAGWDEIVSTSRKIVNEYIPVSESASAIYRNQGVLPEEKQEIRLALKIVLLQESLSINRMSDRISMFERMYTDLCSFQDFTEEDISFLGEFLKNQADAEGLAACYENSKNPAIMRLSTERMELYDDFRSFEKELYDMIHHQKKG